MGRSPLFRRLLDLTGVPTNFGSDETVAHVFESAFELLTIAGIRDEYVYRSALTHKVLTGTHSLNTASMLTEFRAGRSKADLVILNGTATAYEIKSERDSLARLLHQLDDYRRVFASVVVIASENHIPEILKAVTEDVGVLMLSSRYQISTVRNAENRPDRICPITLFESLRATEASSILKRLQVSMPSVPNTQSHAVMRDLFKRLDPTEVHRAMVGTLRQTRNLAPLSTLLAQLPGSLHAAALSVRVRRADHDRLVHAVSTPLHEAMGWS
jgi:hypothetical protein